MTGWKLDEIDHGDEDTLNTSVTSIIIIGGGGVTKVQASRQPLMVAQTSNYNYFNMDLWRHYMMGEWSFKHINRILEKTTIFLHSSYLLYLHGLNIVPT